MHRIRPVSAALLAAGLVLAGCGDSPEEEQANDPASNAARDAALEAAGGEEIGGSVSMLGLLGGEELDAFLEVLKPFEEATGVEVQYEGTRDFAAVLQTRVEGGNPPDVVETPAIGEISAFAAEGNLVDLRKVLGNDALEDNFSTSLIETASLDGEVFGIYSTANLGGLIWYDPSTYEGPTDPASWDELQTWAQEEADDGRTPWCVALESGAASGWPAADFIDEILLRQAGPEFHQSWAAGEQSWTSPEVRAAFETYGETVAEGIVYGDTTTVLSTNFAEAANAIYSEPPGCSILQQATFMGSIITDTFPDLEPGETLDFFPVPDFDPALPGIRSISGEIVGMINQTPQSEALVKYLATPEAGTLIAGTGRWLSPNLNVDDTAYEDPFLRRASEVLVEAEGTYTLGNSLMPQTTVDAFWRAGLDYTQHPDQLDEILASIEETR